MATKAEIEQTILRVAGNPVSGPIKAMAGAFAEAIVELDSADTPKPVKPSRGTSEQREKETRVLGAVEQR
jgi:hypothetical protein